MNLAVIIATRNRPKQLNNLIRSLSDSKTRISQVIIISSGLNVSTIVNHYQELLPLTHFHSEIAGQMFQKIKGIQLISADIDWVMFLDDDVVIWNDAIDTLINDYLKDSKYKDVGGFGLNLTNMRMRKDIKILNKVLKLIGLHSDTPGVVLKNGHVQKYLNSKTDVYTQWLNGLSVWRFDLLKNYNPKFSRIDYAAYEDVFFSYKVSKQCRLLFAAQVYAHNQNSENYIPLTSSQFKAGAYMRFLFVVENKELSTILMIITHFFRTLDFIRCGDPSRSIFYRTKYSVKILSDLVFATTTKAEPLQLLTKRYN